MKIDMNAYRERHPHLAAQMDQANPPVPKVRRTRTQKDLTLFAPEELKWSEHEHQVRLVDWARSEAPQDVRHQTAQLFAPPNGGYRSKRTGGMLKAEGVTAGTSGPNAAHPHAQARGPVDRVEAQERPAQPQAVGTSGPAAGERLPHGRLHGLAGCPERDWPTWGKAVKTLLKVVEAMSVLPEALRSSCEPLCGP